MNSDHFQSQMGRLIDTFGAQHYKRERTQLIWRETASMEPGAFSRVIDRMISEHRQPPMISEFREAISTEREKSWKHEKKENSEDAKKWMEGRMTSNDEERNMMFSAIRQRIKKQMNDADWKCFLELIQTRFGK